MRKPRLRKAKEFARITPLEVAEPGLEPRQFGFRTHTLIIKSEQEISMTFYKMQRR